MYENALYGSFFFFVRLLSIENQIFFKSKHFTLASQNTCALRVLNALLANADAKAAVAVANGFATFEIYDSKNILPNPNQNRNKKKKIQMFCIIGSSQILLQICVLYLPN